MLWGKYRLEYFLGGFHDLGHFYENIWKFRKYHRKAGENSFVYMYNMLGEPSQIESTEMFNVRRPSTFHDRWKK